MIRQGIRPHLATLAEIAENLHRREITALERAELETRWIEVVGKNKPSQVETVSKGGRGNKGGINKASSDLGTPRSSLHKSVKIASLSPDAKEAAKQHGLDNNQSALIKAIVIPMCHTILVVVAHEWRTASERQIAPN